MIESIQNGESVVSDKQKKRHTIKCPNCPAFLNQDHICPSCDTRICKHCRDIIPLDAKIIKPAENGDGSAPTEEVRVQLKKINIQSIDVTQIHSKQLNS